MGRERIAALKRYAISQIRESATGPMVAVAMYSSSRPLSDQKPYIEFAVEPHLAIQIGEHLAEVGRKMTSTHH